MARVETVASWGKDSIPPEYVRPAEEREDLGDAFQLLEAANSSSDDLKIPVIDLRGFLASGVRGEAGRRECVEAVRAAASEWGVMHVVRHGVPRAAMDRVRAAGEGFFRLPVEEKEAYAVKKEAAERKKKMMPQGYGSKLASNASGKLEWEDYFFHLLSPDRLVDLSVWPDHPADYIDATKEFAKHMRTLATTMFSILSLGLGVEEGRLEAELGGGCGGGAEEELRLQLKINYYPRCPRPDLAVGVEAHTDVSALTFILTNGVPGLQVRRDGRWVSVAGDEEAAVIVHVGDTLEIMSNGEYRSVLHRALVNKERARMSWAVFCEPPMEGVAIAPLPELVTEGSAPARFEPRTFAQHVQHKIFRTPIGDDDDPK